MEKLAATAIIRAVLQLSGQLNDIDAQLQTLPENPEREAFLRALGSVMFELDSGLIRPLVRQHRNLDPDR